MLRRTLVFARVLAPLVALALTASGCEGPAEAGSTRRSATRSPAEVASAAAAPVTAAGAQASPPSLGPLAARYQPDVLVQAPEGMDVAVVAKLTALVDPGRSAVLRMGSVPVGDNAASASGAGVDPGAFRALAPQGTAEMTAVWDAVARGEAAVSYDAAKRLGIPLGGTFRAGPPAAGVTLRAGAFADTGLPGVDFVVNQAVADELGLPGPTAVVLSSGSATGLAARARAVAGPGHEVTVLGQSGERVAFMTGSEAAKQFGQLRYELTPDGKVIPDPRWVAANIVSARVPIIGTVTCNRLMIPQLAGALAEIEQAGLADKIHPDEYEGCYVPKLIEDSTSISMHTWGLAVDINVPTNQRGTKGDMDPGVVAIFKKWGFRWGGDYHTVVDPMHFELVALRRS